MFDSEDESKNFARRIYCGRDWFMISTFHEKIPPYYEKQEYVTSEEDYIDLYGESERDQYLKYREERDELSVKWDSLTEKKKDEFDLLAFMLYYDRNSRINKVEEFVNKDRKPPFKENYERYKTRVKHHERKDRKRYQQINGDKIVEFRIRVPEGQNDNTCKKQKNSIDDSVCNTNIFYKNQCSLLTQEDIDIS